MSSVEFLGTEIFDRTLLMSLCMAVVIDGVTGIGNEDPWDSSRSGVSKRSIQGFFVVKEKQGR